MGTFEFRAEAGVKCACCNWETSRLYVRAETEEDASTLLHNTYGCSGCGRLEWEHPNLIGFIGSSRETATPVYSGAVDGACEDFCPRSDALDMGGMCTVCFAEMVAVSGAPLLAPRL